MAIAEYRSASEPARYVEDQVASRNRFLRKSSVQGVEHLIREELSEVLEECSEPDWDGYGAIPVSYDAIANAELLLRALPLGTRLPSVGAVPSGNVSLDWHHSRRRTLTLTVTPCGELHYAALFGAGRTCGTEVFFDEVPRLILDLIARVHEC